jgi:septum formation protein
VLLASSSPRRRELLAGLGVDFDVTSPDVDETRRPGEDAIAYVTRLALDKVAAVGSPAAVLAIAADTTVELPGAQLPGAEVDGRVLEKPVDADDARRMLGSLSGRTHRVHTAMALRFAGRIEHEVVTTDVTFVQLTPAVIDWYVATGEPMGKAGAYALQGAGGALVDRVDGSVTNVIGLPVAQLLAMAARLGRPLIG